MRCALFIVAVFLLAVPPLAVSKTVSLVDAVAIARMHNLNIRELDIKAGLEAKKVDGARASLLPKMSVNWDSVVLGGDAAALRGTAGLPYSYTVAGFQVNQVVYDDASWANYGAAKERNAALIHDIEARRLDIEKQVIFAYLEVLSLMAEAGIAEQALRMSRESMVEAQHRVLVGVARKSEVLRWEVQIASNLQSLNIVRMKTDNAMLKLNAMLNFPLGDLLDLVDMADNVWIASVGRLIENEHLVEMMVGLAVRSLPELRAANDNIKAQNTILMSAKRGMFMPRVTVSMSSGTWFTPQESWNPYAGNRSFSEAFSNGSLTISIPIDTDGFNRSTIDSRAYELKRLHNEREMLYQSIENRVRSAVNMVAAAYHNLQAARSALSASEQNMHMVSKSYKAGEIGMIDLIDAQVNVISTALSQVSAKYNLFLAYVELERSVGITDMADVNSSVANFGILSGL